jgi:uncharacterized membrane protein YhaH (DUF805 family)
MNAYLAGVKGEYKGRSIPIDYDNMIIGRDAASSIKLSDVSVSREHATIRIYDNSFYLQDLNSTAGVYINGTRSQAKALQDGDQIQIGSEVFQFFVKQDSSPYLQVENKSGYYPSNQSSNYKSQGGLFSMDGRNNRSKFFWTNIGINVIAYILSFGLGFIVIYSGGDSVTAQLLAFVFISIPLTIILAFNAVKRLHDLDRPGSHYWYLWIPFYGLYIGLVLLFQKGTSGENQYGPDPCS